jgi:hypothetical protein
MTTADGPKKPSLSARLKAGESIESVPGKEFAERVKRLAKGAGLDRSPSVAKLPHLPSIASLAKEIDALKARVAALEAKLADKS